VFIQVRLEKQVQSALEVFEQPPAAGARDEPVTAAGGRRLATATAFLLATTAAAVDGSFGISLIRAQGVAWAKGLYHALFVASAIEQIITADPQQLTPFDQTVQRFFVSMLPALQVAMLATKLYGLRLALWLSAILPMALGYAVGMIDGLVERSIRRYSGGRESATLYHRAKYVIAGVVGLWLFVFVCLPIPLELQWGSWVAGGVIGVLSRLQWKYYKKYV
jgi:hypothetical protein